MKTFEQHNINEQENLFLELAHLDELEIKFYFIEDIYINSLYYYYKDDCLFIQNKTIENFYINHDKIWVIIAIKFHKNYAKTQNFMSSMIKKHMILNKYNFYYLLSEITINANKHFKNNI